MSTHMDPQACLERWRRAVRAGDLDEAQEAAKDLREWIRGGGFEPKWKSNAEREAVRDTARVALHGARANTAENREKTVRRTEYRRLRGHGASARSAFNSAKFIASWVGTIGDAHFLDYGGGPVYPDGHGGYMLEHVDEPADDGPAFDSPRARWTVYRVDLAPRGIDWVKWADVADSASMTAMELKRLAASKDPMKRAYAFETVAGYYGWYELDQYPMTLTRAEVEERYGKTVTG